MKLKIQIENNGLKTIHEAISNNTTVVFQYYIQPWFS